MEREMVKALKYLCLSMLALTLHLAAQTTVSASGKLDPSRAILSPQTILKVHRPLPEEYIWTANDAAVLSDKTVGLIRKDDSKIEPHFFRNTFVLENVPETASLYVAGPRSARVLLNGQLAADLHCSGGHHFTFHTMTASVQRFLRPGKNVIAIEAVRGWGSHHHTNSLKTSWLNSGEVLAVKIIPAPVGVAAKALVITNESWKSTLHAGAGWESAGFDDIGWPKVQTLGSVEGDADLFQWNADTGMYAWPGYHGEASYLANYRMPPAKVQKVGNHQGAFHHEASLLQYSTGRAKNSFSVNLEQTDESTGLLLDFGREVSGRVVVESDGSKSVGATLQYGESMGELTKAPFLGVSSLDIPAHGEARGPKTAFRYALLHFPHGEGTATFRNIYLDGIYYPVRYSGSFSSSDPRLDRIWEVGAYTAHLCMQDSIWDGVKRDRGRWMGDMEVIDRVVADVFGDQRLMKEALEQLLGPAPVTDHVNGLPGYSAWWIVAEAEYYRRFGDMQQLKSVQQRLPQLLSIMERELDSRGVYVAASGRKPFVDWSKGFDSDSPEARRAMHFEYLLAYREAAWLFAQMGDEKESSFWNSRAEELAGAAQRYLFDNGLQAFGDRWQTNALALLSGAVKPEQQRTIWTSVLSRTVNGRRSSDVITPYLGYYLLSAMAQTGHRVEALEWIRSYWGGMLDEGATSFWEAYDPAWPKEDPHAYLQADGKVGYYTSLAHGWSSGPTAWLMEEILGVKAVEPGFRRVQIRPELAGLKWIKGSVPTPHGLVRVSVDEAGKAIVDLPPGVQADVLLPANSGQSQVTSNSHPLKSVPVEGGTRLHVVLRQTGHFVLSVH